MKEITQECEGSDVEAWKRLAARNPRVLDIQRNPTGWHALDLHARTLLIRADGKRVLEFKSENPRSGTETLRQRILAKCYAVDHPFVAEPVEVPVGELVVQPLVPRI